MSDFWDEVSCNYCGKPVIRRTCKIKNSIAHGHNHYCNKACSNLGRVIGPVLIRSKVIGRPIKAKQDVLNLIKSGLSIKEIGQKLNICRTTIYNYTKNEK